MTLLEKKKWVEDYYHLVPETEWQDFHFNFACVFTKNSTCMEGPDIISVEDVVSIIRGYNVRCSEILKRSVYNHYKAYFRMQDEIKIASELTEETLKNLHEELLRGFIPGGLYRNANISIKGSTHIPCDYIKVYDRMKKYIYDINHTTKNDFQAIAYAHLQLAKIHPFLDGNGRLARLVLNWMLIKYGYIPVSIPAKRKLEYFALLEEFKVNKNAEPFEKFVSELVDLEYDRMMELIRRYKEK